MTDKKESNSVTVAKNSILLAARMVVVTLISIFTTRFLLRNLGVDDFGVYNVTLGIVSMCTFLSPALANAIQRYFSYELGRNGICGAKSVFNASIQIQILMIFVIVAICETIGLWYVLEKLVVPDGRNEATLWVYQISILALSFSMLQVPFVASILAHEHMSFYAIINVIDAVLKLAIAIGIAYSDHDKLVIYGFLLLGVNVFNFIVYCIYSYTYFEEIRIEFNINKHLIKELLSFSGWNLFETVARIGKDQGGNLLLNYYFGPVLNAARGITNQVSYAFSSVIDSTVMASRPQMVISYARGNYQRSLSMFYSLSKGTLLLLFMLSMPVFLDIEYILRLWIGINIPAYSVELIRLTIILLLFDKLASPVTALIHATGNVKEYHLFSGIINIVVLPIAWLFFYLGYNPTSIYIITIVGALLGQCIFLYVVKKLLPFSILTYVKNVCIPFMSVFLLTFFFPTFIEVYLSESFIRLIVVTMVSFIIIPLVSYFIALTEEERKLINSLLKRDNK